MSVSDGEAINAAKRSALVRLLIQHQVFIKAYALVILRDQHLAEETLQEVCLILAADWERVPEGLPLPWLKELIRRKAMDVSRRARRHVLLSPDALIAVGDAMPESGDRGDDLLRTAMIDCVRKLKGDIRSVVEARYGEGMSCEEIAASVGRSVQAVYAMLKRARTTLADCVKRVSPSPGHEGNHA